MHPRNPFRDNVLCLRIVLHFMLSFFWTKLKEKSISCIQCIWKWGTDCPASFNSSAQLWTHGIIPEVSAFGLPLFIYSCLQRSSFSLQLLHHSPAPPGSPPCSHSPSVLRADPHWGQDAIGWLQIIRNINHKEHLDVALQTSLCEICCGKLSSYQWLK